IDLPEVGCVERRKQGTQRAADERLVVGGHYSRVLSVGPKKANVAHRNEPQGITRGCLDPLQAWLLSVRHCRDAPEPLAKSLDGRGEPSEPDRLQYVVGRTLLESRDGVLVVGRYEHDLRRALRALANLESGQLRHAHVEKGHGGRVTLDSRQSRRSIAKLF